MLPLKVWYCENFRPLPSMYALEKNCILPVTYTDEEVERAYEEFYEDVHTEFLKFGEIVNFKACRNGSSHLRGNVYVHYKSLDSAVLSYQSVNGRYFAGKQLQCEFVAVTRWKVAICGEFMKSKFQTCSRGMACNFIHCFRNPGGDYEWADWDKPPPRYWLKKMAALFGYSDESGYERRIERGSPRLFKNSRTLTEDADRLRSQSREIDYSRRSRSHTKDDGRTSEPQRHRRSADRKQPQDSNDEQYGDSSNFREKTHKYAKIDREFVRNRLDRNGGRQSSYGTQACSEGKLGSQDGRSNEMIHETNPDENMRDSNLDNFYHHGHTRRSRRHREKSGHGAGSKGDHWNEDKYRALIQSETSTSAGQQHKVSVSPDDRWDFGRTTYDSDLTRDWYEEDRQSAHIHRNESPRSDGSEEFEHKISKRQKISSVRDHLGGGNEELDHHSESPSNSGQSYRTSKSSSKYFSKTHRDKSDHLKKLDSRGGTSKIQFHEAIRPVPTDNPTEEAAEERGRWKPDKGDFAD